jgi:hypothetical protein
MIGHFQNIKIVVKNINKWHKMIEKRINNNNYGNNYFLFKILIISKIKIHLLKCLKKFMR